MKMAINNKPPQVLQLNPASEILFEGPFDQVVTSYLQLFNPSDQRVCFKVKTTAPRRYCVRPNSGVIEPTCRVKIAIMLQPLEQESQAEKSKHKFMVQTTVVREESTNLDLVWQEATQDKIMDSKLKCVFREFGGAAATKEQQPDVTSSTTKTPPSSSSGKSLDELLTPTISLKQQSAAGDISSRAKDSTETTDASSAAATTTKSPASTSPLSASKNWASNESNLKRVQTPSYSAANKSVSSSHNLSTSFLPPMSDDYKLVLVSLAMIFIGVILGKYII